MTEGNVDLYQHSAQDRDLSPPKASVLIMGKVSDIESAVELDHSQAE